MSPDPGGQSIAIENGRVVTPTGVLRDGHVLVDGDRIASVGPSAAPEPTGRRVDADGYLVMPGLVDLHGDDVERHLFPREEAHVRAETALTTCDRANAAAGITTKYHALAFEDVPGGNRSPAVGADVVRAIDGAESLLVDDRVHARCEVSDPECVDRVVELLDRGLVDVVSIMNHVPGEGQFEDGEQFERRYADGGTDRRVGRLVERRRRHRSDADLAERIDRIVRHAAGAGVPVASHDDADPDEVSRMHDCGVAISEFPVTLDAARRADELGMTTTMGAPNLVRGRSLWGNLAAATAIGDSVLDVLCSDYHPYSLLEAVFVDTGEDLPTRVRRASGAPAAAVGLDDRGELVPGGRADVVIVDPGPPPTVRRTFVGGTETFRARPAR